MVLVLAGRNQKNMIVKTSGHVDGSRIITQNGRGFFNQRHEPTQGKLVAEVNDRRWNPNRENPMLGIYVFTDNPYLDPAFGQIENDLLPPFLGEGVDRPALTGVNNPPPLPGLPIKPQRRVVSARLEGFSGGSPGKRDQLHG